MVYVVLTVLVVVVVVCNLLGDSVEQCRLRAVPGARWGVPAPDFAEGT